MRCGFYAIKHKKTPKYCKTSSIVMDFIPRMIICDGLQSAKSIILYFFPLPVEGSLKKAYGLSKVHLTSLYLLESERKITGSDFILGSLNNFYDFLNLY